MKKAFDALQAKGIAYEFHDYKKQGIDAATLALWLKEMGADKVLNKKGTTWRKLSETEHAHASSNEQNLIETLIAQPSLIKRQCYKLHRALLLALMRRLTRISPLKQKKLKNRVTGLGFFQFKLKLVGTNPSLVTTKRCNTDIAT